MVHPLSASASSTKKVSSPSSGEPHSSYGASFELAVNALIEGLKRAEQWEKKTKRKTGRVALEEACRA